MQTDTMITYVLSTWQILINFFSFKPYSKWLNTTNKSQNTQLHPFVNLRVKNKFLAT